MSFSRVHALCGGCILVMACSTPDTQVAVTDAGTIPVAVRARAPRVLLYTKETEWLHPSTPIATAVMLERGKARGWEVSATNESRIFLDATFAQTDVVVFLNTSGMTMNQGERDAFATYIARGHGWVGAHAASHTDYDWSFMRELVGATFCCHPPMMAANLLVQDTRDPIVSHFPATWAHTDEWYTYDRRPEANPNVKVLLTLDETSARPDYPGPDLSPVLRVGYHATTWTQQFGATRVFYTGLGHPEETWRDELFVSMMIKAIEWASEVANPR